MKQELLDDLRTAAFVSSRAVSFMFVVLVGGFSGGIMGCLIGHPSLTIAVAKPGLFFPLITSNIIRNICMCL